MASTVTPQLNGLSLSSSSSLPKTERYQLEPLPEVEGADPSVAIFDAYRIAAAKLVSEAVGVSIEKAYEGCDTGKKQGDFHIAVARFRLGGKPDPWAQKIVEQFKPSVYLSECKVDKGFVTINMNQESYAYHVLRQIRLLSPHHNTSKEEQSESVKPDEEVAAKPGYGCNHTGKGKLAIVEFSSPNIAKPFHAGHLRSTIIGAFLANLHEACGWKVVRWNYLGDWGKQFGLLAVGFARFGSEEELEKNAVKHLFDVYVRINADAEKDPSIHDEARAFFKRMEDGDKDALALWGSFREDTIVRLKETYARLNIHFDVYGGESQVSPEMMEKQVKLLEEKGMLREDRGAVLCDLDQWKLGKVVIKKGDGTSIYITRDLGGAVERYEKYKFDKMLYVAASQQDYHFKQFFKMLEVLGYEWSSKLQHVNFGMVLGMSTRRGTVKFLDDILQESQTSMHEQMSKNEVKYQQIEDPEYTSDQIGMTAVKIQDFGARRIMDYSFDLGRMTSFEGDTGPYIQYSHVRLCSIERKNPNITLPSNLDLIKTELLSEPKAREILYHIGMYPQIVQDAMLVYEASTIVTYCFRLTHAVSAAWEILKVQGVEEELAQARLYMFLCTRDVLASAMRLLSITPMDRM